MATFIKAGFWEKTRKGYTEWLNLDQLIESKIPAVVTTSTTTTLPPYKVYTALLTQTGTNAPVATVLENTIGNIVWARNNTGIYQAVLVGAFTLNKTHLLSGTLEVLNNAALIFFRISEDSIILQVSVNGFISDDLLSNFSIEIRVYN